MPKKAAPKTPMEELVGSTLLSEMGTRKPTKELLKNVDLVLLYFSASWCPPCRKFSPLLSDFHKKYASSLKFEIIYVSSDKDIDSFTDYYGTMPFLAIPPEGTAQLKNTLAQSLHITGIPALIVLDRKTAHFVTDNARAQVTTVCSSNNKSTEEEVATLIQAWKDTTPVPFEQAVSQQEKPSVWATLFQMFVAKPWYIIGVVYVIKVAMRKLPILLGKGEDEDGGEL